MKLEMCFRSLLLVIAIMTIEGRKASVAEEFKLPVEEIKPLIGIDRAGKFEAGLECINRQKLSKAQKENAVNALYSSFALPFEPIGKELDKEEPNFWLSKQYAKHQRKSFPAAVDLAKNEELKRLIYSSKHERCVPKPGSRPAFFDQTYMKRLHSLYLRSFYY